MGWDISEAVDEIVDFATGEDSDVARRTAELTENYDRSTALLESREGTNRSRTGDTTDADSVVVPEAFDGMSHPEMFAYTTELTPELLDSGAAMWREAHTRMTTLVWALWNELGSILGTDWQGAAADGAFSSVTGYRTESLRTLDLMDIIAGKLEQSRDGFALTRATMPAPQSFTPSDWARTAMTAAMLGPIGAAGSVTAMMAEEEERRAQAVAVMNGTYVPTVVRADHGVPVLPPPDDPAGGTAAQIAVGRGVAGTGGGGGADSGSLGAASTMTGAGDSASAGSARAASETGSGAPAETTAASATGQEPVSSPAGTAAPTTTTTSGTGATGPGAAGVVAAPTTSARSSGRSGSAGGGSGSGRGGSGSSRGGSASSRSPFGTRQGTSGGGSTGQIMQSASGSGGGRGMGYGPAGMMPGGRAGGDQDTEHRTAGYLVTADNGDELVGELPLVAPPVIG